VSDLYVLTEEAVTKLARVIERLAGTTNNTPGGLIRTLDRVLSQPNRTEREPGFWIKITGNATNGTNQWKYAWTEQVRTSTGWQNAANARSGTTSSDFALNACEANNSGSGVQGNSVDIDGQTFTDNSDLELQPVQGNPVVWARRGTDTSGNACLTFEYQNAIDGECA